jgi:hypothetical protein
MSFVAQLPHGLAGWNGHCHREDNGTRDGDSQIVWGYRAEVSNYQCHARTNGDGVRARKISVAATGGAAMYAPLGKYVRAPI